MPEGLFQEPPFVSDLKKELRDEKGVVHHIPEDYIRETLSPHYPETEYITKGIECVVVGHPHNENLVVAYQYDKPNENPIRALEIYHLHRFFSNLFPHNFPRFRAAVSHHNLFTVRDRIKPIDTEKVKYPFRRAYQACLAIGIPLYVDFTQQNFVIGLDGGQYYLDTIKNDNQKDEWSQINIQKLEEYMTKHHLSGMKQKEIRSSLRRLGELQAISSGYRYLKRPETIPKKWRTNHPGFWQELSKQSGFDPKNEQDSISQSRIVKTIGVLEKLRP